MSAHDQRRSVDGGAPRASCADRLAAYPAFGWRLDTHVPDFPDDRPVIVFDGVCALCSGFVRFVARHDREAVFRFIAAQSPLGTALMRHFGLDPVNFETNLLIDEGRAYGKLAAFERILARLAAPWPVIGRLAGYHGRGGDWVYDRIARNRYALFGRYDHCVRPDPDWSERVIGD